MNWEKSDFQGMNPWVSGHVKQTPHDPNMIWASNQYLIVFKGRTVDMKTLTLIEEPTEEVHTYIYFFRYSLKSIKCQMFQPLISGLG